MTLFGKAYNCQDFLTASQHLRVLPSPLPKSLPAPLCLLTQLWQSCYQFTTPVKARRPMLTVKDPLFWTTRVTEKGRAGGPRRKRERGFDSPPPSLFSFNSELNPPTALNRGIMSCFAQEKARSVEQTV